MVAMQILYIVTPVKVPFCKVCVGCIKKLTKVICKTELLCNPVRGTLQRSLLKTYRAL
jgi:hypothetical protein